MNDKIAEKILRDHGRKDLISWINKIEQEQRHDDFIVELWIAERLQCSLEKAHWFRMHAEQTPDIIKPLCRKRSKKTKS